MQGGYEQALAVALGRELRAGLDDGAPMYWAAQSPATSVAQLPALPDRAVSLYSVVTAPDALKAALSAVGVVDDRDTGAALAAHLQPGQMLVSKDGYGWRWDGYTVTPQAQATAQERETKQLLEQRNRLGVLKNEREAAVSETDKAQQAYQKAQDEQNAVRAQTTEARQQLNQLQRDAGQTRQQLAQAEKKHAEAQARRQSLQDKQHDVAQRLQQLEQHQAQLTGQIDALPPEADSQTQINDLQDSTRQAETSYRDADQAFLGMNARQTQWQNRLGTIGRDLAEWQSRQLTATQRLQSLDARHEKLQESFAQLKSPDHVQEEIASAEHALRSCEKEQESLGSRRSELVAQRNALDGRNQELQENLMTAREALVRAETQFHNGETMQAQLLERCEQNLGCTPKDIAEQFSFSDDELGQNLQTIRNKQERGRNERDRIGAVNLRAEEESQVLGAEIETLTTEKDDILAAIEKLRHGISTLNRDARRKMLAAFEEVNERFKEVFVRLFNGGEAYLQLIDAEDPLEAGLEIYAQPPGKRLQTLTLLSGGEQSLTAIALVFAMFLTHPSPICILDEIDAALDDANVERICSLLSDFAKTHPTRFLVITHNPITMTHMNRLYGVTMVEKGISKLVSVDLEKHSQQSLMALAAE